MADQLAFEVADSLQRIIPTDALGLTIRHAVLEDFAASLRVRERRGGELKANLTRWAQHHQKQDDPLPLDRCVVDLASPELAGDRLLILSVPLAKMLGWFIQHFPTSAQLRKRSQMAGWRVR
ncbi:hypothetical protein ABZ915_44670 [Streptomyces sp. NPDC046915]|uniref:hypothetical protein n=1 Tax=Streptomyces sp. NPDC046915 TaxID=3155257 RepID=UPI0033F01831